MAIYRTGQASMDAQGYITGYDTKWREQLTLIRPGATIFFIDAPFQAAVISEVISDTQIRAITTGGAEIGRSNYIILLHDSITVDGLAQDVAETLRYYQSKETQIEEAIEFFKTFDWEAFKVMVDQVKGDAEKTANDRAATEQLKNNTQQIKDSAVAETNKIKSDTDAIKAQTQQIKDSAIIETEAIKQEAFGARDQAVLARDAAGNHAVDANNAKVGAETARDEARQWAQQVHPENLLHKDQNLNDLADKAEARKVLQVQAVISSDPASHSAPGDYNSFTNPQASYELRIANNGEWRVVRNDDDATSALSIGAGGTGATSIDGVRHKLGIATNHSPVFGGIDLQALNGTTSGIAALRNRNAEGVQISYSMIYNEIQGGVAKTTIKTTREGGGTNYFQIDENGLITNVRAIRCVPSNVGGDGFTVGVVPGGALIDWRDRPAGMIVEHPGDDVAVNILKSVRFGGDWVMGIDAARYGDGSCEARLNVKGNTYIFNDAGYASAVQWVNTSDIRLKANLKEIENAKEKVKSIKGYTYFKRNNLDEDEHSFYSEEAGVIAQDVQIVLPEAVYKISNSEYLGVSYGGVTALLVNAFNEISDQVDKQQEEIETLKSEIEDLKAVVSALINKNKTSDN